MITINGTTGIAGTNGSAGTPAVQGEDTNTGIFFPAADTVAVATGGSERVRVDSSGNVGVGVTPSAWGSSGKVVEVGVAGNALWGRLASELHLGQNFYNNSSNSRRYANNGFASDYSQESGAHIFYTAPSGTAGNAITFTQAMTLDSSGNLLVGTTSGSEKLVVNGDVKFPTRRRGFVAANGVSAGTTGTYNIDITGFNGQGSGTADYQTRFYFITVGSFTANHQVQATGLYTNNFNGNALFLGTLGSYAFNGSSTFTINGTSPRVTITNSSGNTPTYYAEFVPLN